MQQMRYTLNPTMESWCVSGYNREVEQPIRIEYAVIHII